jgi:uncharacterized protein
MSLRSLNFLLEGVYAAATKKMGRGVFTQFDIEAGTQIELAPVIVMSGSDRKLLDQTLLHDYIFEWGGRRSECCMALGLVPLYNHSYTSNCEYEMEFKKQLITVRAVRRISAGEELFINYNGTWNDPKKLWFDVK